MTNWSHALNITYVVVCSKDLLRYSEDTLAEKLKNQGVAKVMKIKKKFDGVLTPTPSLIVSFHAQVLPFMLREAWLQLPVRSYILLPYRCYILSSELHAGWNCRVVIVVG